jgi:signal transduction histidine kinase
VLTIYSLTVVLALLAVVVGGTVTIWLLSRHDRGTSAFAFGIVTVVITWWSASHLGTLLASTLRWQLLFTQLSYVGVVFAPVSWLVFVLRYVDRNEWLSTYRIALVSVVPVVTLALVFTARSHSLFYTTYAMETVAGYPVLRVGTGPWYLVNIVYSYTVLVIGVGLLLSSALSLNRLYRRQAIVLVLLTVLPWLVSGTYLLGIRPIPWVDPTPFAFVAMSVPFAALIVRTDLRVYLPVAHERVFRTLDDPILIVGPTQEIVDANAAAQEVFADGDRIEGTPVAEVLPEDLLDEDRLGLPFAEPVEYTMTHGGRQRQYLARRRVVDPERNPDVQGSVLSLTDITVQKEQQQALEEKTATLETRTDQLERKNQQLERLANVVSHDLSTPLSTAEKILSLLRTDLEDPNPQVERTLDDLAAVHDRLRGFADHLPRLARESIDVETTVECDLERVARAAWKTVETDDLELVVTNSQTFQGDRQRLQQAFENLFRNSVQHGSASGREVPIEASDGETPTADGATKVRVGTFDAGIFVEDDGSGIDPEQRETVFEYGMSTADSSGVGLAIVRTVVEAHGWEVDLTESEAGGVRFEFRTGDRHD